MIIQILIILFILFAISKVILRYRDRVLSISEMILWTFFWILVGVTVAYPNFTQIIAEFVGVGRGVDLVVYVSIVLLFYGVFRTLVRLDIIERNITKVVRDKALQEKPLKGGKENE